MPKREEGDCYPVIVSPPEEDGRQRVLALTEDGVESGCLGPAREGEPCGTLVRLSDGHGPFRMMEVVHGSLGKGPPKVVSDSYRAGWESIFGHKDVGQA